MIVLQIALILLLYSTFGILHTWLASIKLKQKTAVRFPRFMPYYRISYNLLALCHFYLIYEYSPRIDIKLYDAQPPFDLVILGIQIAALLFLVYAVLHIDGKEFLGINQLIHGIKQSYNPAQLDEHSVLYTSGPYRISRHPLYLGSIIFLAARPYMFLDYLIQFLCITAYFYIGAVFEERKLTEKFGAEYQAYQKNTPMIVPFIR